jgi:hypothetical protein
MITAVECGAWQGCELTPSQIRKAAQLYTCPVCELAKRRAASVPSNEDEPVEEWLSSKTAGVGQIISIDPVPVKPATKEGSNYYWLSVDVCSGNLVSCTTRDKPATTYIEVLKYFLDYYESRGFPVKIVRTDAERVLLTPEVRAYMRERKVRPQNSVPGSHWQNRVERAIQDVNKGVSALLHGQQWIKAAYWDRALMHYCDTRNVQPNAKTHDKSPRELIEGRKLSLEHEFKFAFGDFVGVNFPSDEKEWKFDLRNDLAIYLGEAEEKRGHRLLFPFTGQELVRLDVFRLDITDGEFLRLHSIASSMRDGRL